MYFVFILFILVVLVCFFIIQIWEYEIEKKDWNNGVCAKSGSPWIFVKAFPCGTRLYKDGYDDYIWNTFNFE